MLPNPATAPNPASEGMDQLRETEALASTQEADTDEGAEGTLQAVIEKVEEGGLNPASFSA